MHNIEVRSLTKSFGSVVALDELEFTARPGRVTGFLGPNGSGKTTTMRILLGLTQQSGGTATIGGRPYESLNNPVREVGAAIAADAFHPARSGRDHLRIMAIAARIPRDRVDQVLDRVGLTEAAGRKVGGYSMGMRQRLALAAAFLGDPGVLVLDEPLNGLDPEGIVWIRQELRRLAGEGRTVLLSSHLLSEVSQTVDDVVVIAQGRCVAQRALADLTSHGRTIVRTPHAAALLTALVASGRRSRRIDDTTIEVEGTDTAEVGLLAAQEGVVVTQLLAEHDRLEELFQQLTTNERTSS